jgi:hypothetical protein
LNSLGLHFRGRKQIHQAVGEWNRNPALELRTTLECGRYRRREIQRDTSRLSPAFLSEAVKLLDAAYAKTDEEPTENQPDSGA